MLLHLKEVPIIHDTRNHIDHVVRLIALRRDNRIECNIGAARIILRNLSWGVIKIVGGQETQQLANRRQALLVIMRHKVSHARDLIVCHCPA